MTAITLIEAVTMALAYALRTDERVVLFGEDVGLNGGVFRATQGLQETFGEERVFDTPLSENLISGLAVGLSAQGMRPVAEIQFTGFIHAALDQLLSHAVRLRNRTRGRLSSPMVLRAPYGGGIHAPEHHSESLEALFAHMPGLKVVVPSFPEQAYGLLLAAIADPDPVVFFEPKRVYRKVKQIVPDNGQALPLGKCFTHRQGADLTLVSWGAMLYETLEAAKQLASEGIEATVIDVATIKPLDFDTIFASVAQTGRCVIVQEAPGTCSVSSEISAQVSENCFSSLSVPVKRVTGYEAIMPLYRLEGHYMPTVSRILDTVKESMEFA